MDYLKVGQTVKVVSTPQWKNADRILGKVGTILSVDDNGVAELRCGGFSIFVDAGMCELVDECGQEECPQWRVARQQRIGRWCLEAFGPESLRVPQRGIRFFEEAVETAQAVGLSVEDLVKVIRYVYARPKGNLGQELGGVAVTLLALAHAAGLNAEECEAREIRRILNKPIEHFTRRNQEKNDAGLLIRQDLTAGMPDLGYQLAQKPLHTAYANLNEDGTISVHDLQDFRSIEVKVTDPKDIAKVLDGHSDTDVGYQVDPGWLREMYNAGQDE